MKLDVFGREVEIVRSDGFWKTFYLGNEGKKRLAQDINIPKDLPESEILDYLADLCHEWATPRNNRVKVLPKKDPGKL